MGKFNLLILATGKLTAVEHRLYAVSRFEAGDGSVNLQYYFLANQTK